MSLHQCSSDRELAQSRNTHKFSRLRSHCQEPSNSEAAWLKASPQTLLRHLHPRNTWTLNPKHLPVFLPTYRRLSWALPVSRNLRLYAIFAKEKHRNTRVFPEKQTSIEAAFPTRPQQRDTCPNAFSRAGLMQSDSCPCKFRADLVLCRSKRGYGAPKAHPNAFTGPA